jgi:hypothetical protein
MPDGEDSTPERPVGFDSKEALTERDETHDVENSVGIQIMELNPISKEETPKERMRGKRKPSKEKSEKNYPEARRWPGYDFWDGGENLRRIILQEADLLGARQLSVANLVWTQCPMADWSASVVLTFFVAAPPAAPATVEFLLPMAAALNKNFAGMEGGRVVSQEQNVRKKLTAVEWG